MAAYGFGSLSGDTFADASGKGNSGTVSGATSTSAGKNGKALAFDGINDSATVADSPSLDLTTGMTIEAWVRPTTVDKAWRQAVLKESSGGLAYGLYTNDDQGRPAGYGNVGRDHAAQGSAALSANVWSHVTTTYNGRTLRMFVNGVQTGATTIRGSLLTSGNALKLGGNTVWGEYFEGTMDDVRIYNRALSRTEIKADMAAGV